ncbi:MAG TPA: hypothetical protein VL443_10515 [Cyclobacteriaceae bacterium]|nr:hypothetical protein [Cyclobacteriaceae bacterium]
MKYLVLIILFLNEFAWVDGLAQQNPETLRKEFDNYSKHTLQEKIFIHTDRASYFTGETIWLKVYYRDASYNNPLSLSNVGYIEILDNQNKPVIQTKISLTEKGNGNGAIYLPVSLNSGNYVLRAYTNWMKNFSSDLFFQQPITIINPFTKLGLKPVNTDPQYDLQFLPEGGNLVNGITSVVGFRLVDKNGKGQNLKGAILTESNDTVVTFKPLVFGLGKFKFTPSSNHTYKAVLVGANSKTSTFSFPEIKKFGYVVRVKDTLTGKISISVKMTSEIPVENPTVYCAIQSQQTLKYCEQQFLVNGQREFLIDKKILSEGISHVTIFDSNLNPVCERLYYKDVTENLDITASLNQFKFTPRKKVEINIQSLVKSVPVAESDLSIAVYKTDSTETDQQKIQSYLYLTSELKGRIESPDYYIENTSDPKRAEAIDNLLLTHGWSRYHWSDIRTKPVINYVPEAGGHIINALLIDKFSGEKAKDVTAFLSTPGKNFKFYLSKSDANGKLFFETQDFFGAHELVIQTNTLYDSTYKVELTSPFSSQKSNFFTTPFNIDETLKNSIEQRSLDMQVQNVFYEKENEMIQEKTLDSISFFGSADEKYRLDDYTRFPTMEEVMREYVPGVMVRKQKGKFHFLTINTVGKTLFRNDPLVLLDGVPVFDVDKIMAFDPRKVKFLDVVSKKYYFGTSSFDGVVSYRTYKGDLGGFQPDPKSLIVNYEGMQQQREFFSPKYETTQQRESRIPDTRNLLYWSPSISTINGSGHVEFYTSDIIGKYKIVIQGITNDGQAGSSITTFEVSDKLNY